MPDVSGRGLGARAALALRALGTDENGTSTLEYALLLALVALSSIAAFQALARLTSGQAGEAARTLGNPGAQGTGLRDLLGIEE